MQWFYISTISWFYISTIYIYISTMQWFYISTIYISTMTILGSAFFYINFPKKILVLIGYLVSDFEKPKGGPLEIEKFFVEGGFTKGVRGGKEPSKTLLHIFFNLK